MGGCGSDVGEPVVYAVREKCFCGSIRVVEVKFVGGKRAADGELRWCVGGDYNVVEACLKDL